MKYNLMTKKSLIPIIVLFIICVGLALWFVKNKQENQIPVNQDPQQAQKQTPDQQIQQQQMMQNMQMMQKYEEQKKRNSQ